MSQPPARFKLSELAARFELGLRGDGDHEVCRVGTLTNGGSDSITFLANRAYRNQLKETRAGAVILRGEDARANPANSLISDNPYLTYARIAALFDPLPKAEPGVHAGASVDATAELGAKVHVAAGAVISANCRIGAGSEIGPGCVLLRDSVLGDSCRLVANVTLGPGVVLGHRVLVHAGAVIGADGFGIARAEDGWEKVPQLGSVQIGDDCEIGANTCIDRGAITDTVLEEDVRIDNLCQIGHNCHIGAHTALAAFTGLSGSTKIGRHCLFAGRAGTHGHIEIADGVTVAANTTVTKSITEPGVTLGAGIPAQPIRDWQRTLANMKRMDRIVRRLRKIERNTRNSEDHE